MAERVTKTENEKAQLQSQISQLNAAIVALKGEQSQQSDAALEIERRVKEKEQVISELGSVINSQKATIVGMKGNREVMIRVS